MKSRQRRAAERSVRATRRESSHEELLARALGHHQSGQLDLAAAGYRAALQISPQQPDALHLLGMVAFQTGQPDIAERLIRQALTRAPAQPTFWNSLAAVQQSLGLLADAERSLMQAVTVAPGYVDGWSNLVHVRGASGDQSGEADALATLTRLAPSDVRWWSRRGVLASAAGDQQTAVDCFARAATLAPGDAEILTNLGALQLMLGQTTESVASQRRAFALRPDLAIVSRNLGAALLASGDAQEAATYFRLAVSLVPAEAAGWISLGHALNQLARYAGAVDAFERAVKLASENFDALLGLADALQADGRLEEAVDAYQRAHLVHADHAESQRRLGMTLWRLKRQSEAVAAFQRSLNAHPDQPTLHSSLIYALDLMVGAESEARAERRRWNERFGRPGGAQTVRHANEPNPERILRIGYVSGHLRPSSAGYAILPILKAHDRTQVTVICYSNATPLESAQDGVDRFRQATDQWRDVAHLSDTELVQQIQADEIDILVDVSGHMVGNRLPTFAYRPAPVQVTAWGHAAGAGLEAIQYFLADPVAVPAATHHVYPEEIVNLPTLICYPPPPGTPAIADSPMVRRGHITFGAFNRLAKVNSGVIAAWATILRAAPTARLVIKTPSQDSESDRLRLRDELVTLGVDATRIELRSATAQSDHLASHADIDVMLDSFPHTGGVTTAEALIMGVPSVTLLGEQVSGRVSASLLMAVGLERLVAASVHEYIEIAVRLASQGEWLGRERAVLRDRWLASPVGNADLYTAAVEHVYRKMWRRWCAEAPGRAQAV